MFNNYIMNFLKKIAKSSEGSQFSINNIPYGVYKRLNSNGKASCCTRLGEFVIDLGYLS